MTKALHPSPLAPVIPERWTAPLARNAGWIAAAGAAVALAGSAIFNRASARRAEAETPPVGKFVEVDGVRLHYVDRREKGARGPAVVLLHGNGFLLQDWAVSGVLDHVARAHRVIAFDRPGFGYSDRPRSTIWTPEAQGRLIARALDALGIERAVVVGHSWGTMVALAMALERKDLVAGLVLISGYYHPTVRADVPVFALPAVPILGDVMANTVSPLSGRLIGPAAIKASFAPAPVPDRFVQFPIALTLRPSQVRATAADTALMVPGAVTLSRRYGELTLPIMVMAGDGDLVVFPRNHAERLAAELDSAELQIVPGQGHLLHYAVPERVAAAIGQVAARA